jgi:hypothetical protein
LSGHRRIPGCTEAQWQGKLYDRTNPAAEFISNKFASFNLEPFQTYSVFYHPFSPYDNPETDIQANQITWNGKVLSAKQFYYSYTLPLSKKRP